ncbi:MAG: phosphoribosylaminoimidazolesuccinocarboxamide synthase [Chloroflexi bacterium]|nr:phosphoribosylaminoimidazolesuccinocarboxamide synthase [Chloroflexota bacterium]
MTTLAQTDLPNLFYRGKVRDTFLMDERTLLVVATDRISAFDVVLPNAIPDKGRVLNLLSAFWFQKTAHIVPNHLLEVVDDVRLLQRFRSTDTCFVYPRYLEGRSMLVKMAQRLDVECVVRGYLAGSAWTEYRRSGTVSGQRLPEGLVESQRLPQPLFTPTTKAEAGHDQPITFDQMAGTVGLDQAQAIREVTLALYQYAHDHALPRQVIIADTKFEFGLVDGQLTVIDEMLTPDSSRFWDAGRYAPGASQPSFDKQPVRDWLVASGWSQEPPAPDLPADVVAQTTTRYREGYRRLTGQGLPR